MIFLGTNFMSLKTGEGEDEALTLPSNSSHHSTPGLQPEHSPLSLTEDATVQVVQLDLQNRRKPRVLQNRG